MADREKMPAGIGHIVPGLDDGALTGSFFDSMNTNSARGMTLSPY